MFKNLKKFKNKTAIITEKNNYFFYTFTKKYDKFKELINHLSIKTSIHPSVFSISSINKLPINLNFKPKLKLN